MVEEVDGSSNASYAEVELSSRSGLAYRRVVPLSFSSGAADDTFAPDGKMYVYTTPLCCLSQGYKVAIDSSTNSWNITQVARGGVLDGLSAAFCTSEAAYAWSYLNKEYRMAASS